MNEGWEQKKDHRIESIRKRLTIPMWPGFLTSDFDFGRGPVPTQGTCAANGTIKVEMQASVNLESKDV